MELFFAGAEAFADMVFSEPGNILMSYYYMKDKMPKFNDYLENKSPDKKLFIDSGAFTAWTKNKVIDVNEYIDWLNTHSKHIDLFGQIDTIPGDIVKGSTPEQVQEAAEKTWENYLYMRSRVKNPDGLLYTFHVGEPYSFLRRALDWRDADGRAIPYIAFGGMVKKPMPVKRAFLDSCFNIIKESSNPNVKVHAFGMTSMDILEQYPITSADSTSWIMTGANGNIQVDTGTIAISEKGKILPEHYTHLDMEHRLAFEKSIAQYGFTLHELQHDYKARLRYHLRYISSRSKDIVYKGGISRMRLF